MPRLVSHPDEVIVLKRRFGQGAANIDKYVELEGYAAVQKAIAQGVDEMPAWIINTMKSSGLRGRGGAGFPTGMKWSPRSNRIGPLADNRSSGKQCRTYRGGDSTAS